ncbi:MAG: hypothetical protein ACTSRP_25925 [Candidatus Helarchaeota archaeon]
MRLIKIINGFVTNSSSSSAPLVIAIKHGLKFSDILRKLGFDVSNSFLKSTARRLDQIFLNGKIIDLGYDEELDDKTLKELMEDYGWAKKIPSQCKRGYQISKISVEVQVYSGGGWTNIIDGFLVKLGWETSSVTLKKILEDDLIIIHKGDAEDY